MLKQKQLIFFISVGLSLNSLAFADRVGAPQPPKRHRPRPPARTPAPPTQRGNCPIGSTTRDVQCVVNGRSRGQPINMIFRLTGGEYAGDLVRGNTYNVHFQRRRNNLNFVDITFVGSVAGNPPQLLRPEQPEISFDVHPSFSDGSQISFTMSCVLLPLEQTDCFDPGLNCIKACRPGDSAALLLSPSTEALVPAPAGSSEVKANSAE